MLPEGKYEWYSPTKNMSVEAATIFNKLSLLGTLPHIPSAIMNIQLLLQDESTPSNVLANAIRLEPLVASTLLTTASNIKFARTGDKKPIDAIEHAVAYVGIEMLSQLMHMASLKSFKISTRLFTTELFWKEAFTTAHFAAVIAAKCASQIPKDHIYLAGTLCNVGKVVGSLLNPADIDGIFTFVNDPKTLCTWRGAEKRTQKYAHTILGEIGGAIWGFPKYVLEATRFHHDPASSGIKTSVDALSLVETVAIAINLAHWSRLEPSRMDRDLMLRYSAKVGLTESDLELIVTEYRNKSQVG